jgi:hypothetical protein
MDQGIAAVVAGVAGLVGAGIGGLATAYGARIGAQKTIEAAQTQVQHQATAEHGHWVREQRRQVCSNIVSAWSAFMSPAGRCYIAIKSSEAIPQEEVLALHERLLELNDANAAPQLWGPDELVLAAQAVAASSMRMHRCALRWHDALDGGDQAAIEAHQATAETVLEEARRAWHAFQAVTRSTLAAPS